MTVLKTEKNSTFLGVPWGFLRVSLGFYTQKPVFLEENP